jgi:hypothetical protein
VGAGLPANNRFCRLRAPVACFCGCPALILSVLASPGAAVSQLTRCGSFMPLKQATGSHSRERCQRIRGQGPLPQN